MAPKISVEGPRQDHPVTYLVTTLVVFLSAIGVFFVAAWPAGCNWSEEEKTEVAVELVKVSDLRMVSLHFMDGFITKHVVHEAEVPALVEASLKLHHNPGVNPHNGEGAAKLREIFLWRLERSGPYWWTGPSLQPGDKEGAGVYDWNIYRQLWPEGKKPIPVRTW